MAIHDAMFKVFRQTRFLVGLLKLIFPNDVFELIDPSKIKLRESSSAGPRQQDQHADLVVEVGLRGFTEPLVIYLILEHKSVNNPEAILQVLGYYAELCKETKGIVVPAIIVCCKDKKSNVPSDYLTMAMRKLKNIPLPLQRYLKPRANFFSIVCNIWDISDEKLLSGDAAGIILYAMRNFWYATDDHVAEIIDKSRGIDREDAKLLLSKLMSYYKNTDKVLGHEEFDRVERQRWPQLREEDRLMPEILLGYDRYFADGLTKGRTEGKTEERSAVAIRLLKAGVNEGIVRQTTKISKKELTQLKKSL